MALPNAILGARRTGPTITWMRSNGVYVDLTGATLTGVIRNVATGVSRAIDGTLTVVKADQGRFTWAYGVQDVSQAGGFQLQFRAQYVDTTYELSIAEAWEVTTAL